MPAAPSAHSHQVSKSRKRKSDGGDVDPEKVKRLRAAVDFAKRGKLPFDEDVATPHDLKFAAESTAAELRDG